MYFNSYNYYSNIMILVCIKKARIDMDFVKEEKSKLKFREAKGGILSKKTPE
jgi:hypothetical protein